MNHITMDSAVYDKLMERLDLIEAEIKRSVRKDGYPLSERWVDNDSLAIALNCSKRTLQMYREEQMLPYTQIKHRIFYKTADVDSFMNKYFVINDTNKGRRRKRICRR